MWPEIRGNYVPVSKNLDAGTAYSVRISRYVCKYAGKKLCSVYTLKRGTELFPRKPNPVFLLFSKIPMLFHATAIYRRDSSMHTLPWHGVEVCGQLKALVPVSLDKLIVLHIGQKTK